MGFARLIRRVSQHQQYRAMQRDMKAIGVGGPGWYDRRYAVGGKGSPYQLHYTESAYYFLWTVVADRLRDYRRILEIGSGSGQFAHLLRDNGFDEYVGFDFSPAAVAIARSALPGVRFEVADALTTGLFSSTAYDAVVSTETLEHVEDDLAVLRRVRCGARIIATVPSFDYPGHYRFFENADEVRRRYASTVSHLEVTTIRRDVRGTAYFLLDGVAAGDSSEAQ